MKKYIVFSFSQNKKLAAQLASDLGCELGVVSATTFADGEVLVKSLSDVKGKDAIVIESTFKNVHERLFEFMLLLDSIYRSGANSIKLFIPYFGYSRQERVSYFNEPVSAEVISKIIETAHYDEIYAFDLHHTDISKFFERPLVNLPTSDLFVEYYGNIIKDNNLDKSDFVVISPDHGANQRADNVAAGLGVNKIILDKVRPAPNKAEHLALKGDVKGKTCIIIDDIVDTGGTIASAAKLLYSHGATSVLLGASHAIFSGNCYQKLKNAKIKDIAVTDSIEKKLPRSVKVLSLAKLIKKVI